MLWNKKCYIFLKFLFKGKRWEKDMVLVDTKQEPSSTSLPLNIMPKDAKETTLSFSALLKGIDTPKENNKIVQNGLLVLSLTDEDVSVKQILSSDRLQGKKEVKVGATQAKKTSDVLPLELNPVITQNITSVELKVVIHQAKQYIKSKIMNSEAFTKKEIKSLPKTLKGLIQVAKKIGLDISKITLEQVQSQTKISNTSTLLLKRHSSLPIEEEKLQTPKRSVIALKDEVMHKDVKVEVKPVPKWEINDKIELKQATPLFKAQTKVEITTQEIVNVKTMNVASKSIKQKTQNTLELLLRGNKSAKKDTNLTADFSVATAKVIVPSAKTKLSENLESLLKKSDSKENETESKTDGFYVAKADSFEVKLNEAKQMVKYLSHDVKTAIEDYKSPFTRLKIQLNPQKLGEIDLTIVQRGKNLHVNLSSNNAAINTLTMNVNDLKLQLNNNGINNATLSFSNNSQSSDQGTGSQTQQQQQNRQNAQDEYNYFDKEESNEEIISSLEIIVPHYV
jgi:flagellar hook-length control protein FliK